MKQVLLLLGMVALMSCAMIPEQEQRNKKPKKTRQELIKACVFELADTHGVKQATESCLKIYKMGL